MGLTPVKSSEPLSGVELLKQELTHKAVHSDLENFDVEKLQPVKTSEPLSGAELLKKELTQKAVNSDLEQFNATELKKTETEEKNLLPDSEMIREEKQTP